MPQGRSPPPLMQGVRVLVSPPMKPRRLAPGQLWLHAGGAGCAELCRAAVNSHDGSETAVQIETRRSVSTPACARAWPPPPTRTKDRKRFPQIKVQRLRGNPAHVRVSQLWGANILN